jgi:hypothetical protein
MSQEVDDAMRRMAEMGVTQQIGVTLGPVKVEDVREWDWMREAGPFAEMAFAGLDGAEVYFSVSGPFLSRDDAKSHRYAAMLGMRELRGLVGENDPCDEAAGTST